VSAQASEKARAALAAEVQRALAEGAPRLQSVAKLARRAGVAYVTMWKQVAALARDGVLEARPRRGIRVIGSVVPLPASVPPPSPAPRRTRWQELRSRIASDILAGVYAPGDSLPLPKALRQTFGVSHRTLRKALGALAAVGCLSAYKRTYRVPPLSGSPAGRVVLVGRGDRSGGLHLFYAQRNQDFFYTLEQECSRGGVKLDLYPYEEGRRQLYDGSGRAIPIDSLGRLSMLGALFYTTGISDPSLQALVEPIAARGRPLAALDESSSTVLGRLAERHASFRLHLLGQSEIHGELMARHLLGLGHRHVCYVSPMHGSSWSQRRLAGLRAAFAAAGAPDVAAVTSRSVSAADVSPRLRTVTRRTVGVLRRFAGLGGGPRGGDLTTVIRQLREQANEIVNVAIPRRDLRRLFDQALQAPGCTAWVGANDMVAREMLAYLREHGRDVPGDISVAGFDDTDREFRQDLTSYNFNLPAVVRGMLGHVLDWRPARAALKAPGPVELEGFVCARRTTGRAKAGR